MTTLPDNTLQAYKERFRNTSELTFTRLHPHAFFVVYSFSAGDGSSQNHEFHTNTASRAAILAAKKAYDRVLTPGASPPDEATIIPLVPRNPEQRTEMRIGRARNNDIVLDDANVSKLHAWLGIERGGYRLKDADAANGTRVNDESIQTRQSALLRDGDIIVFGGRIYAWFCTAKTLFVWLTPAET